MKWTDAELNELRIKWLAGESAAVISKALNRSRGAVIGKLDRLGLLRQRDKVLDGPRPVSLPKVSLE